MANVVSAEEVVVQLEDIHRTVFRGGDTVEYRILELVVRRKLAGHRTIEPEIRRELGIPGDPADASVRVRKYRIAQKLKRYYSQRGWLATIDINLRPGDWTPEIRVRSADERLTPDELECLLDAQAASDRQTLSSCAEALTALGRLRRVLPAALVIEADVHLILSIQGSRPGPELMRAEELANRALELAQDFAPAHATLGFIHATFGRWAAARRAFARFSRLQSPGGRVHFNHVAWMISQGQLDEAIGLSEPWARTFSGYYELHTQPPSVVLADLGVLYLFTDDLRTARSTLRAAARSAPRGYYIPGIYLALLEEAEDNPAAGLAVLDKMVASHGAEPTLALGVAAMLNGLAGRKDAAVAIIGQMNAARAAGHYVPPTQLAISWMGLGDLDRALSCLAEAAETPDPIFLWMGSFPFCRHMAHRPEFHALLTAKGLRWRWTRRGSR